MAALDSETKRSNQGGIKKKQREREIMNASINLNHREHFEIEKLTLFPFQT